MVGTLLIKDIKELLNQLQKEIWEADISLMKLKYELGVPPDTDDNNPIYKEIHKIGYHITISERLVEELNQLVDKLSQVINKINKQ